MKKILYQSKPFNFGKYSKIYLEYLSYMSQRTSLHQLLNQFKNVIKKKVKIKVFPFLISTFQTFAENILKSYFPETTFNSPIFNSIERNYSILGNVAMTSENLV